MVSAESASNTSFTWLGVVVVAVVALSFGLYSQKHRLPGLPREAAAPQRLALSDDESAVSTTYTTRRRHAATTVRP